MNIARIWSFAVIAAMVSVLNGCTVMNPSSISLDTCSAQIIERIYFGANTPTGVVSEKNWEAFLLRTITPSFPHGLTVITGKGQWLGKDGMITHEQSRIVELVHQESEEDAHAIEVIIAAYKEQFQQEAVLQIRYAAQACLK